MFLKTIRHLALPSILLIVAIQFLDCNFAALAFADEEEISEQKIISSNVPAVATEEPTVFLSAQQTPSKLVPEEKEDDEGEKDKDHSEETDPDKISNKSDNAAILLLDKKNGFALKTDGDQSTATFIQRKLDSDGNILSGEKIETEIDVSHPDILKDGKLNVDSEGVSARKSECTNFRTSDGECVWGAETEWSGKELTEQKRANDEAANQRQVQEHLRKAEEDLKKEQETEQSKTKSESTE